MNRPVVLLGCRARIAVPFARSLSRRGIPVILAYNPLRGDAIVPSRSIRRNVPLPLSGPDQRSANMLLDLVQRHRADMIVPATDWDLQVLASLQEKLRPLAFVAAPARAAVSNVLSKIRSTQTALRLGIPTPRTFWTDEAGLPDDWSDRIGFPAIGKARDKFELVPLRSQLYYFADIDALRTTLREEPDFLRHMLIQEYLGGQDVHVAILMHGGSAIATYQCRALRNSMPFGGVSVVTRSEPVEPLLLAHATRLLRELSWEGIAEIDFRHDPKTGNILFLEINGRFWGSLDSAVNAGVDFPFYLWQIAHGEMPQATRDYPLGVRTRHLRGDMARAGRMFLLAGKSRGGVRWHPFIELLRDFHRATKDSLWSLRDPLPAIWDILAPMKDRMLRHISGRAR